MMIRSLALAVGLLVACGSSKKQSTTPAPPPPTPAGDPAPGTAAGAPAPEQPEVASPSDTAAPPPAEKAMKSKTRGPTKKGDSADPCEGGQ